MINSYFRKNIEARMNVIYQAIAQRVSSDNLIEPLLTATAVYQPLTVDADWIVTCGLCLNDSATDEFYIGEMSAWTIEILARHKTNPDYWVEIVIDSVFSNSGIYTSDSKAKVDVANMSTYLDFEAMKAFSEKLTTAIANIDFATGTVLFNKVNTAPD